MKNKHDKLEQFLKKNKFRNLSNEKQNEIFWKAPNYYDSTLLINQGFKIHISATILNAVTIIDKVAPYLFNNKIQFKIICNLNKLRIINSGVYGFSQVGKFITIYPESVSHAKKIINDLHLITKEFKGPKIPSDIQYLDSKVLFYRYGLIKGNLIIKPNGKKVKDLRLPHKPIPNWIEDPFLYEKKTVNKKNNNYFGKKFIIIETLRQRGKGGVYRALQLPDPKKGILAKTVIIKEARENGEFEKNGFDSRERLKWQSKIQKKLNKLDLAPKILTSFEDNNSLFIAMEDLGKNNLKNNILTNANYLKKEKMKIIFNLITAIKKCHEKNIYLLDLSPDNIMISENLNVKLIDFEHSFKPGGLPISKEGMGTPGFYIKTNHTIKGLVLRDLFALGSILYCIYNPKWYQNLISNYKIGNRITSRPKLNKSISLEIRKGIQFALKGKFRSVKEMYDYFSNSELGKKICQV